MMERTYIFDLDNTIYPVSAIGNKLFKPLFELIEKSGEVDKDLNVIKRDIMRRPFQVVAKTNHFSEELTKKGIALLANLRYSDAINYFPDYEAVLKLNGDKFLVTTGFEKLQWSKIDALGIKKDFKNIYVVDPAQSTLTKKDVFGQIIIDNRLEKEEVMVIGDDPESEIRAAEELGITTVLYEREIQSPDAKADYKINDFTDLLRL